MLFSSCEAPGVPPFGASVEHFLSAGRQFLALGTRSASFMSDGGFPRGWEAKCKQVAHCTWEKTMNWDQIEGNWKQFKGKVKQQWGDLTDDELDVLSGKRDELAGRLQERYGWEKERAERELDSFVKSL
jgi:uncharacterized protein YjbJ (UPF0337 family)